MACLEFKHKNTLYQMNFSNMEDARNFLDTNSYLKDLTKYKGGLILVGSPFNISAKTQKSLGVTVSNALDFTDSQKLDEFITAYKTIKKDKRHVMEYMYIDPQIANVIKSKIEGEYEGITVEIEQNPKDENVKITLQGIEDAKKKPIAKTAAQAEYTDVAKTFTANIQAVDNTVDVKGIQIYDDVSNESTTSNEVVEEAELVEYTPLDPDPNAVKHLLNNRVGILNTIRNLYDKQNKFRGMKLGDIVANIAKAFNIELVHKDEAINAIERGPGIVGVYYELFGDIAAYDNLKVNESIMVSQELFNTATDLIQNIIHTALLYNNGTFTQYTKKGETFLDLNGFVVHVPKNSTLAFKFTENPRIQGANEVTFSDEEAFEIAKGFVENLKNDDAFKHDSFQTYSSKVFKLVPRAVKENEKVKSKEKAKPTKPEPKNSETPKPTKSRKNILEPSKVHVVAEAHRLALIAMKSLKSTGKKNDQNDLMVQLIKILSLATTDPSKIQFGSKSDYNRATNTITIDSKYKGAVTAYTQGKDLTGAQVASLHDYAKSVIHETIHAVLYNNIVPMRAYTFKQGTAQFIEIAGIAIEVTGANTKAATVYNAILAEDYATLNDEELIADAFTGANFTKFRHMSDWSSPSDYSKDYKIDTVQVNVIYEEDQNIMNFVHFEPAYTELQDPYKGKQDFDRIVDDFSNLYRRHSDNFLERQLGLNYEAKIDGYKLDPFMGPLMLRPGDLVEVPFRESHKDKASNTWVTTSIDEEKSMYKVVIRSFPVNETFVYTKTYMDRNGDERTITREIQKVVIQLGYKDNKGVNRTDWITNELVLDEHMELIKSIRKKVGHANIDEFVPFTDADYAEFQAGMSEYQGPKGGKYKAPDFKKFKVIGNYQNKNFHENDYEFAKELSNTLERNDLAFAVKRGDMIKRHWRDKEDDKDVATWSPVVESRADGVVVAYKGKDNKIGYMYVPRENVLEVAFNTEHVKEIIQRDHEEMYDLVQRHWDSEDEYNFRTDGNYKRHFMEFTDEDKRINILKFMDIQKKNLALIEYEHKGETKRRYVPILAVSKTTIYYPIVWNSKGDIDMNDENTEFSIGKATIYDEAKGKKTGRVLQILTDVSDYNIPYQKLQSVKSQLSEAWSDYSKGDKPPGISMEDTYALHHPTPGMVLKLKPGDIIKKRFTNSDGQEGSVWVVFKGFDKRGRIKTIYQKTYKYDKGGGESKIYKNYTDFTLNYEDIEAIGLDRENHAEYFEYKEERARDFFTNEKHFNIQYEELSAKQLAHLGTVDEEMVYDWKDKKGIHLNVVNGRPWGFLKARLEEHDGKTKLILVPKESDDYEGYVNLEVKDPYGVFVAREGNQFMQYSTYLKNPDGEIMDMDLIMDNYKPGMIIEVKGEYEGRKYTTKYLVDKIYQAGDKPRLYMYGKDWDPVRGSYWNEHDELNIKYMAVDLEWFLDTHDMIMIHSKYKHRARIETLREEGGLSTKTKASRKSMLPVGESVSDIHKLNDVVASLQALYPEVEFELHRDGGTERASVQGNKVRINVDNASLGDPIHELGHMFFPMLMADNPELYENLRAEVENHPLYKEVALTYTELDEQGLFEETFVTLMGRNQEQPKGLFQHFFDFVKGLLVKAFGLRVHTLGPIQLVSLDDLTNLYAKSILEREYIDNIKVDLIKQLNIQSYC